MQRFNRAQAARRLGVSRSTLYRWLGQSDQKVFTPKELARLAASHGRVPRARDDLAAQMTALQEVVDRLGERVAALEAARQGLQMSHAERAAQKVVSRPSGDLAPNSENPLPPRVRTLVARWVAGHGGNENTIRRWPDLPLEPREALRFVQERMIALGYRVGYARLHQCENPQCVCHQVLAD